MAKPSVHAPMAPPSRRAANGRACSAASVLVVTGSYTDDRGCGLTSPGACQSARPRCVWRGDASTLRPVPPYGRDHRGARALRSRAGCGGHDRATGQLGRRSVHGGGAEREGAAAPGTEQRALSSTVQHKLQSHGAEGRRLAQIVRTTAPAQAATPKRSQPSGKAADPAVQALGRGAAGARAARRLAARLRRQGDRRRLGLGRDGSRPAAAAGGEHHGARSRRAVASP